MYKYLNYLDKGYVFKHKEIKTGLSLAEMLALLTGDCVNDGGDYLEIVREEGESVKTTLICKMKDGFSVRKELWIQE